MQRDYETPECSSDIRRLLYHALRCAKTSDYDSLLTDPSDVHERSNCLSHVAEQERDEVGGDVSSDEDMILRVT